MPTPLVKLYEFFYFVIHNIHQKFCIPKLFIHINISKVCQEDGSRLFSAHFNNRTRSDGHKVKQKFHPNMRKDFFTQRVAEGWNRLPRALTEFSSEQVPGVICPGWPCLGSVIGPNVFQKSLPTLTILWFKKATFNIPLECFCLVIILP